ncbi:MAG: hypothetical protein ACYS8W_14615 [Planctomycetota bacterium]|jgi:hypothetical protein
MPEIRPFIGCCPTAALLGKPGGFPGALAGVSLSRAYADGLLVRGRTEALYRIETDFKDPFGHRFIRSEILGFAPELKSGRKCVVVEKVPAASRQGKNPFSIPLARGIYLDATETLRQVFTQRQSEAVVLEIEKDGIRLRIKPVHAPELETVLSVLRDSSWFVPVSDGVPEGPMLLSLANWYSGGTRFERAYHYSGESGKAGKALSELRKQLKNDYLIREYPGGGDEGARAALMEAVEDLKFETGKLPGFAVRATGADSVSLFIGRGPLSKSKAGFFSLAKQAPTRERVRKEVVEPVMKDCGLKAGLREDKPRLTLYLPDTRPDEYEKFATSGFGPTLDLVAKPDAPGDYVFPESHYKTV